MIRRENTRQCEKSKYHMLRDYLWTVDLCSLWIYAIIHIDCLVGNDQKQKLQNFKSETLGFLSSLWISESKMNVRVQCIKLIFVDGIYSIQ